MRRMETRDGARAIDRTEKSARREEKPCCCITLNLPEYLLSRPYSVYIRSPMHMAPKRVFSFLLSFFFSLSLSLFLRLPSSFSPSFSLSRVLSFILSYSSLHACLVCSFDFSFILHSSLVLSVILPFLFLLRLFSKLTHPFLTLSGISGVPLRYPQNFHREKPEVS